MASSLEDGIEGVAAFTQDYQRLIDATQRIHPGLRCVFLSPLGHLSESHEKKHVYASSLVAYTKAVRHLADSNNGVFVDLSHIARDDELRKDPIQLHDAG